MLSNPHTPGSAKISEEEEDKENDKEKNYGRRVVGDGGEDKDSLRSDIAVATKATHESHPLHLFVQ